MRLRALVRLAALAASTLLALPLIGAVTAAPATAHALGLGESAASPPTYTWPEFSHDPQLSGVSGDPSISTANAATLGVSWMANTGATALGSPIVAWNAKDRATLIFTSNEAGYFTAYNQSTHEPVWSVGFGGGMRSTPLAEGPYVWVAPSTAHRIYKLDAGTGAVQCSAPLPFNTDDSATIATPPGGSKTVYIGVNDSGDHNGPLVAIDEATCTVDFSATPEPQPGTGGIWSAISYSVDAQGTPLVVFGTADPDAAVYAVNAITGAKVWRYATQNPPPGIFDIGAGVTISPPGVNGIADGMAYVVNKDGYFDALDLTTGKLRWTVKRSGTISTPALDGAKLIYGDGTGVTSLNAVTGSLNWHTNSGSPIDGSIDITGPAGSHVATYGDLGGAVHVLSVVTGTELFHYQTGNFIVSALAEDDGNLILTSADGFLYDFVPGGGTGAAPATAVTSPANSSSVPNPNGSLTISGTAGSPSGPAVGSVAVAIQQGGASGTWWDSATSSWTAAPYGNPAKLNAPGAPTTHWTLSLPVPSSGGSFEVFASSAGSNGVADIASEQSPPTASRVTFSVRPSSTAPVITSSSAWAAPLSTQSVAGSGFQSGEKITVTLGGTAVASANATSSGRLPSTNFTVPTSLAFGPTSLVAVGHTSGTSTSTPIYVTNSWGESRAGNTRTGSEPNDSVLADHLSISSSTFLTQAWSFTSGAPIETSPAVVDAVAYLADNSGGVYAVSVRTGMQLWMHQVAGSAAVDSSPAVDLTTTNGSVVFGTAAGSVVALRATDGEVKWSVSLGSSAIESSPAIANGVVYVGSDSGTLYALNELNGSVIWHASLGSAIHSSPAVDAGANLVVVGDDAGKIVALSTDNGATLWTSATGGPVVATPIVSAGAVFVGSGDGKLYRLNESSGARVWTTALTGPITASPALLGATLFVGDQNGHAAYVNPNTGTQEFTQTYGRRGCRHLEHHRIYCGRAGERGDFGIEGTRPRGLVDSTQLGAELSPHDHQRRDPGHRRGWDAALLHYSGEPRVLKGFAQPAHITPLTFQDEPGAAGCPSS